MIGKILGNRYEIVEKIGSGGMALVYKARCQLLNRYVAIKILRPEFTNDEEFINKFKRESQAAASLSHPNIVNIYDVGVEDNTYYIVMECIDGKTLKEIIKEKGKLTPEETIDIATQIAEALNHAHINHIVHRDIKPHNIMVNKDGRVKVADFGIARAATASTVTNTSNVIGSVHYFSPEQARGGFTDEKSDIYSLGVVMYEMATGRVPFEGESPISVALKHIQEEIIKPSIIDESIPKNLETIIMKCVEKDQTLRYNNTQELLSDLKKVKNGEGDEYIHLKDYDDSPTRVIPAVKDDMIMENKKKKKRIEKKDLGNGKKAITIAAIILAFLVTSGLATGFLLVKNYLSVEEITVPNIIGLNEEIAKEKLENLGLQYVVKSEEFNNEYKEGHIIKQNINPGDVVKKGYPVEVIVSKGHKMVEVPELVNRYSYELDILLDDAGLDEGNVSYEYSDIPSGIILRQNPEPYTTVPEGSTVDVVISQGPKISYVIMPNLVGKNVETAKREILAKGFAVGETKYEPSNEHDKDIVIGQNYPAGSEVEENTSIDLIVSSGPEENNAGDNTDDNNDEDEQNDNSEDEQSNEQEKAIQLVVKLPQDREEVEVTIYKIQDDSKELVYNKKHNTSEEGISVTLSGKGRVKFEIYFDGEFKDQREIQF